MPQVASTAACSSAANTLLRRPHWIFADEATSALDEAIEAWLYEALLQMVQAQGGGLLSVAHRPGVAVFHSRRWVLEPDEAANGYRVMER